MHPLPRRRPSRHAVPRPRCGTRPPLVPAQRTAVRLVMIAEPGCSPLWVDSGSGVVNTAASDLPLPADLVRGIGMWGSDVETDQPDEEFFARGMRLAIRLAEALGPQSTVHFFDGREGSLRLV